MFAKLALLILTVAGAAAAQLSVRHQRLQTVHEMTVAVNQEAALGRRFQQLRVRVAQAVAPQRVHELAAAQWDLVPIRMDWSAPPETIAAAPQSDAPEPLDPFIGPSLNKPDAEFVGPEPFTSHTAGAADALNHS